MVDSFSKFALFKEIPNKEAETVARIFWGKFGILFFLFATINSHRWWNRPAHKGNEGALGLFANLRKSNYTATTPNKCTGKSFEQTYCTIFKGHDR